MIGPNNLGLIPQLAGHPRKVWIVTYNFKGEKYSGYASNSSVENSIQLTRR
jgi:hypothetical protein